VRSLLIVSRGFVRRHFKIRLPEVNIGIDNQALRAEVGFERKLGKSPLSVNVSVGNEIDRFPYGGNRILAIGEAQVRWYYRQKHQLRKGRASDNLSGLYVAPRFAYHFYRWVENYDVLVNPRKRVSDFWDTRMGITAGYQQRLFNKLYFDAGVSFSGKSLENRLFKIRYGELQAKAGIGFAL